MDLMFVPGSERIWRRRLLGKAMALLYHRVAPSGEHGFLVDGGSPTTTPEEFDRDISFLDGLGARFLTFADLRQGIFPSPNEFAVLVTFDDGFKDTYQRGLGYLNARGIRATVFQSSAMIANERKLIAEHLLYWHASQPGWWDVLSRLLISEGWTNWLGNDCRHTIWRLLHEAPQNTLQQIVTSLRTGLDDEAELCRAMYPTEQDLRDAKSQGHEIGSHGHEHLHRGTLDSDEFESDIRHSRSRLAEILGEPPRSFSYPFNARAAGDVERCSRYFSQVATVDAKLIDEHTNPLEVPRFSWPGAAVNEFRRRRWLLTGRI
jgi:peptidoglycan/xylan/chitin deacetylase (PgdA/CDA1 family)